MCYNSVTASTPQYLADLLQIYTPSRTLRSTADTRKLKIPLFKKKYSGQRSSSCQGPVTWNKLPFSIRHTQTYSSFKSQLKNHLFSQTFQETPPPPPPFFFFFFCLFLVLIVVMLFVFNLQSWDVSMVHVLLHCMSGLH